MGLVEGPISLNAALYITVYCILELIYEVLGSGMFTGFSQFALRM